MTNLSFALRDSATMLRRDVRHSLRNLKMTVSGLLTPTITLLLFVYFFARASVPTSTTSRPRSLS